MATHDYIISNASGASVRADLNNALAAIVSNNSNATSPATTYAYQWWADTTTGQLKLRNSANSAWITIFELDGTMLMEDGSNASPGLAFASDLDTGFFKGGTNQIGFATAGVARLHIGSSEVVFNDPSNDVDFRVESNGNTHMLFVDAGNDRIGIGTSSPDTELDVAGDITAGRDQTSGYANLYFFDERENQSARFGRISKNYDSPFDLKLTASTSSATVPIIFNTSLTDEAARINTSGDVLVGKTTTALTTVGTRISGSGFITNAASSSSTNLGTNSGGNISLANTDSTDNNFSNIGGYNSNGLVVNQINLINKSHSSRTGEIAFSTHNGSSLTERMRIDSSGNLLIGLTSAVSTGTPADLNSTEIGRGIINISRDDTAAIDHIRFAKNGSVASSIGTSTTNSLTFKTGTTEAMRISDAQHVAIGTTTVNRTFQVGKSGAETFEFEPGESANNNLSLHFNRNTSQYITNEQRAIKHTFLAQTVEKVRVDSNGLTFNGDTAAANALDDYEEGTWNINNNGDSTGVISSSHCKYTKIGRLVTVHFVIGVSTGFTGSSIAGLPFDPANVSGAPSSVHGLIPIRSSSGTYFLQINSGGDTMSVLAASGGGNATLTNGNNPYRGSFTYQTA